MPGKRVNVYEDVFGRIFLNSLDKQDVWFKVLNAVDMELVYDRYECSLSPCSALASIFLFSMLISQRAQHIPCFCDDSCRSKGNGI